MAVNRMQVTIFFLYGVTLFQQTNQQQHPQPQDSIHFETHPKPASPPLLPLAFPNLQPSISNQQKLAQPTMMTFNNGPSIQSHEPIQRFSVSSTIQQPPALHTITFNNGPSIPEGVKLSSVPSTIQQQSLLNTITFNNNPYVQPPESLQSTSVSSTIQQQPALNTIMFNNGPSIPLPLHPPQSILSSSIQKPSPEQSTYNLVGNTSQPTRGGVSIQKSLSIPRAMLSLALEMGRCTGNSHDCISNTVFSPFSIASTLTMLLMGTSIDSNCYKQLRAALRYHRETSDSDINEVYGFLMQRIKKLDVDAGASILLSVANGLFSQKQSRFSNDYLAQAQNYFHSEVRELDITMNPYGSANIINSWVSEKTSGKITNIMSSLPPDTQMVVANAVYFNANWAHPFSPEETRMSDFIVSPTEKLLVPTMHQHIELLYVESSELNCKMIGMPYKGEELSMFILLPTEKEGINSLNKLEGQLTVDVLEQLFTSMVNKTVSIQLPKFRIHQKLQLKNALRGLGVSDLFNPSSADLSRMTSKSGLAVDNIVHQTFIEVTESGTEAAAATVLNLSRDGPSKSFVANQPFIFLIRDIPSKAVLFFGRVVRPETARATPF